MVVNGGLCLWMLYLFLGLHSGGIGVIAAPLMSPLCSAVQSGQLDNVEKVLQDPKTNVNEACSFVKTLYPLSTAASKGFVDIGALLIIKGADVNQKEVMGYTPLLRAAESLQLKFIELLIDSDANIRVNLMPMSGINLGFNALNLATAGYIGKYPFVSPEEKISLTQQYSDIARLLRKKCYPAKLMQSSIERLQFESYDKLAEELMKIAAEPAKECK